MVCNNHIVVCTFLTSGKNPRCVFKTITSHPSARKWVCGNGRHRRSNVFTQQRFLIETLAVSSSAKMSTNEFVGQGTLLAMASPGWRACKKWLVVSSTPQGVPAPPAACTSPPQVSSSSSSFRRSSRTRNLPASPSQSAAATYEHGDMSISDAQSRAGLGNRSAQLYDTQ